MILHNDIKKLSSGTNTWLTTRSALKQLAMIPPETLNPFGPTAKSAQNQRNIGHVSLFAKRFRFCTDIQNISTVL